MELDEKPDKLFTLEEANRLIPTLRPLIKQIVAKRAALIDIQPDIQKARDKSRLGGGSVYGSAYLLLLLSLSELVAEIEAIGVLVKDYRTGLCDFPHLRDGRIIYLCWKMDEDEIGYWHDIEAGFAGRQPLE
jgi:hypothetical protein